MWLLYAWHDHERCGAVAAAKVAAGTDPGGNTYASTAYKRHVAGVYACKAIAGAIRRAVG